MARQSASRAERNETKDENTHASQGHALDPRSATTAIRKRAPSARDPSPRPNVIRVLTAHDPTPAFEQGSSNPHMLLQLSPYCKQKFEIRCREGSGRLLQPWKPLGP
jgi:hypothetical protein